MMARTKYVVLFSLLTLLGCNPSQPEAHAPKTNGAEGAQAPSVAAQPSASSESDAANADDLPNPAQAARQAESQDAPPDSSASSLRQLAARLIEPDSAGGWRISEPAALELEKRGTEASAELWTLLEDPSAETRRGAAFYLLGQFNPNRPEQVDSFLRLLQDKDNLVRGIALQAVQQMREADLVTSQALLTPNLDSAHEPDPNQRATVARILQRLKTKAAESAPNLGNTAANDPDPKVRAAALVALAQVAPTGVVVASAQDALADADANVRLVAAARLRQLGKPSLPAAEALAKVLSDPDQRVRTASAEALVKLGADAVPALVTQVGAPSIQARQLAVACLSRIGPPAKDALPELQKRLKDEDETVRKLAAVAIGKIDPSQSQPAEAK